MNVVVLLLLGLIPAFGYAYEMVIKHDPWWAYELNGNNIDSSYQFFHPYYKEKPKRNNFGWNYPTTSTTIHKMPTMDLRKVPKVDFSKIPMPKMPPIPQVPKKPRKMSEERWRAMNAREWPDWIPPIRMIKLPLDDPPAF